MSLSLDKRQRAMLREMGVRVWTPAVPVAAVAAELPQKPALDLPQVDLAASLASPVVVKTPVAAPAPAVEIALRAPERQAPRSPAMTREDGAASWRIGEAVALYAEAASAEGPRWLVLAETPAVALQAGAFNPFQGDAGKLLDNMLRAARLNKAGVALLAPLVRLAASGGAGDLAATLAALVAAAQPDVVLVMGRLAAQALLQSDQPFGKLRGQVHALHDAPVIVTYDATFLLRSPADKAKAWDDLCLAMRLAAESGNPG